MTPRTASHAISEVILKEFDGEWLPNQSILDSDGKYIVDKKHCTLRQLLDHNLISEKEVKSYLKFTTIRNPFDSLVSLYIKMQNQYQYLINDLDSFVHKVPGFVKDVEFCRTHSFNDWIYQRHHVSLLRRILKKGQKSLFKKFIDGMDLILRFENLHKDLQMCFDSVGVNKEVNLPIFNKTSNKLNNYRVYYSQCSRGIVEYTFQKDLLDFNYKF
jgi:hypothetical protein